MEIKDFKEMTENHIEICKTIIREDGCCELIACFECPFYCENSLEFEGCHQYGENNESFVKSAKEFIELYNNEDIKVNEEKNNIKLDLNIFTMDFGKMDVSTGEHFDKVYEEYNELDEAFEIYDYKEAEGYSVNEEDRKNLSNEALDMVQASISFVSHLIEEGIMTNEDIEAWKTKLEDRKKKYLK